MKNDGATNSDLFHQRVQANSQASRAFAAMLAQKAFNARSADAAEAAQGFKTYDFSHIAPQDMKSAISRLLKNGRMSFDESTSLVGVVPSPSNTFHQPMNFFTAIQEGIDGALARNETASAQYLSEALQALIRLQGKPVASN